MNGGADVRSIAALREWLAALVTYRSEAGESLAGIGMEIRRGLDWVADQYDQWHKAIRDCEDEVAQAKLELSARKWQGFDGREPDTTLQERNLRRAEAKLEHARDQVRRCKSWLAKLPKIIEETYTGAAHRLETFLEGDMTRGMALLDRQIDSLERYAETRADFSIAPSAALLPPAPKPPTPEGSP